MDTSKRIKMIREDLGKGQKEMSVLVGVGMRTWQAYEEGVHDPSWKVVMRLSELGYNADWLATGEGEMARGKEPSKRAEIMHLSLDDYMVLPVYVTGGAGDPYELIPADPIEEVFVPKLFYSPSIVPVKVKGRSMERTLRDGAVVGVDRADKDVVNGELYAVWLPYQGTVIKRLYLDNKKILLQSDNEEFRCRDIEIDITEADEHFIQGRVKWVVQVL